MWRFLSSTVERKGQNIDVTHPCHPHPCPPTLTTPQNLERARRTGLFASV